MLSTKKCISLAAFLLLGLAAVNSYAIDGNGQNQATPIPVFTPYDLEANTGYIEYGSILAGPFTFPGQSMVIDPPNHRVAFFFGPAGNFVTDDTGSYEWSGDGSSGCFKYPEFTYTKFVTNFKGIKAGVEATTQDALYEGLIKDSHSCNHDILFGLRVKPAGKSNAPTSVIQRMTASAPSVRGSACVVGQAIFVGDLSTVDTTSNRDALFVKPVSCATPIDYCSFAYPVGNPCAEPQ